MDWDRCMVFAKKELCATYWGYIGIMEKKMETTTLYRDYIVVQNKRIMNLMRRGFFVLSAGAEDWRTDLSEAWSI